jgi:hypothetical protein
MRPKPARSPNLSYVESVAGFTRERRLVKITAWTGFAPVLLAAIVGLQGCSLLSFESPAKPLPRRDLNARMLTREYAEQFRTTVAEAADEIAAQSEDPDIDLSALRWKISATTASRRAATQMAPMMGLLDSWAVSAQMREFLTSGAGSTLFGEQQAIARAAAESLAQDIISLAQALTSKDEFASYQQFVEEYVREQPFTDIRFARTSVAARWAAKTGQQATLLSTVGTVPEAMSDVADRMRLYGDQIPAESVWQTQLALRQAGYGDVNLQQVMQGIDARLAAISKLAETSPELVHDAIADLRAGIMDVADRFDQSTALLNQSLQQQLATLTASVREERLALTETFDVQRAAITKDAERVATQVTEASWRHVRVMARELAIYWFLSVILVLGLPFVAGYLVGRARALRGNRLV